jgi:hypothetical protein
MDIKHITSQSLRRLLSLTEKKDKLIKGVEELETEIAKTLKGVATSVVEVAEVIVPPKRARKTKAGKAGGLKERILDLLDAAGDEGLRVKEIAEKLGAKAGNISVWFSTTGKKHTRKIKPGRYAAKGSAKKAATKAKPAKAKKKSHLSAAGRARIAAATKARWAARRAGKAPAKKTKTKKKA